MEKEKFFEERAIGERLEKYGVSLKNGVAPGEALKGLENVFNSHNKVAAVRVICHRPKAYVEVGKMNAARGLAESDLWNFIEKTSTSTRVVAFPYFNKKAKAIEQEVRYLLQKCHIGNSDYMELSVFETDFLPKFVSAEKKLEALKEELKPDYQDSLVDFAESTRKLVSQLVLSQDEKNRIEASIQSMESKPVDDFLNSVSFSLLSGFDSNLITDAELREVAAIGERAKTASLVEEIIQGCLLDSFESLSGFYCSVNSRCKDDDLSGAENLKEKLKKRSRIVSAGNVGNSTLLEKLAEQLLSLASLNDKWEALERGYLLMTDILSVCLDLDMESELHKKRLPKDIDWEVLEDEVKDRRSRGESLLS